MKKGFPDINLPVPKGGFHGLYIELKREKGWTLSPDQERWLRELKSHCYYAVICHGYSECISVIEKYLNLK